MVNSRTLRKTILRDVRDSFAGIVGGGRMLRVPTDASSAVVQCYNEAADYLRHQEATLSTQLAQIKEVQQKKIAHLDLQLQSEQYELNMSTCILF